MNSLFTIFFHFFIYLTIFQIQSWLMIKKYLLHYFQLSSFFLLHYCHLLSLSSSRYFLFSSLNTYCFFLIFFPNPQLTHSFIILFFPSFSTLTTIPLITSTFFFFLLFFIYLFIFLTFMDLCLLYFYL
jgi:hypothetical protein